MATMTAYQMVEWGHEPEFVEVAVPSPGPDEVLVRMSACGLCHSDLNVMAYVPGGDNAQPGSTMQVPFTLGHENAGWIARLGTDVVNLEEGDPVIISGVHSCGRCSFCVRGLDNMCWRPRSQVTRGVGEDGGLAEYVIAPARELVRLRELDPSVAPPLSDAGATSYHAVKGTLPVLVPGSTAVVLGAGGLGGYALQYLRLLSPARVIAVDPIPERREYAEEIGAHESLAPDGSTVEAIREATNGRGAEAVLDFAGTDDTLQTGAAVAAALGRHVVCGMSAGSFSAGWHSMAPGCQFSLSLGYTLSELAEVVVLAEQGSVRIESERFSFDRIPDAYDALRSGAVKSRAVVEVAAS